MKKITFIAVFLALYLNASAQNFGFNAEKRPEDVGDPYQKHMLKTLMYNGVETQFGYGDFNDLSTDFTDASTISGTGDLYFRTTDGAYHTIPSKAFSYVYQIENDDAGNVLIATDQGVFQLTSNGTLLKLIEGMTKCICPRPAGELIYTVEVSSEDEDITNTTEVYLQSGTGTVLLFTNQAIIRGYGESDTIGTFSFSAQAGCGIDADNYVFQINLNTWEVLPHAEPYEPANDGSYRASGGYGPIAEANGKLYMYGNYTLAEVLEWNGDSWVETPLTNWNSQMQGINGELYIGPFKINPDDYSYESIPVVGGQMAAGNVNFFNGEVYAFDAELDHISIGPNTTDIEDFSLNIDSFMPSSVVRLGEVTGIHNVYSEISIYPNPANDVVIVDGVVDITIVDLTGQIVPFVKNGNTINVENLSQGMYILTAKDAMKSGVMYTARLLIQR